MRDAKESEVRRLEIMNAAMQLFMEKGYTNTTTQDIVDKVNISRGLLYYHFKNKEDILYCLVEQYSDKLLKDIHVIVYDEDKTAIEKIRAFIDATIISSENISAEGTELQKTVDLDENRYMIDKLSHKIIEKLMSQQPGVPFESASIFNKRINLKQILIKNRYRCLFTLLNVTTYTITRKLEPVIISRAELKVMISQINANYRKNFKDLE